MKILFVTHSGLVMATPRKEKRGPRPKKLNPIHAAIRNWFDTNPLSGSHDSQTWKDSLLEHAPKRFTIYEPMALLPTGSFANLPWTTTLPEVGEVARDRLWSMILRELSHQAKGDLTHLAVNEGIPLHKEGAEHENVLRSPSGLRILLGDFGPAQSSTDGCGEDEDFDKTLWVSTKQNGIYQTWAPRWTMFSRGNIKEKARLLGFKLGATDGHHDAWAVDLYAGIGYFVFSYATLGMRVLCWEINPWSVEGLRRGAVANGWTVRVVRGSDLQLPEEELLAGGEQIVVFLEGNEEALRRVRSLQASGLAENIKHVNCGFLPTSESTWKACWEMTVSSSEAWLHLHENVGVNDTETRRQSVQNMYEEWAKGSERKARAEHVELVKTFAPSVWHCVFDVHITRSTTSIT